MREKSELLLALYSGVFVNVWMPHAAVMKNILCLIVFVLLLPGTIVAADAETGGHRETMPVQQLHLQAKLLNAVLKFSSHRLEQVTVGVVHQEDEELMAQNFAGEMEKLVYNARAISCKLVPVGELHALDPAVNVLYVTPGTEDVLDRILEISVEKSIFSCSGIPAYAKAGKIVLAFDSLHGNPQILLNLSLARRVDFDFKNPKFLNLQSTGKLILIK